jgi:hypothetical protein
MIGSRGTADEQKLGLGKAGWREMNEASQGLDCSSDSHGTYFQRLPLCQCWKYDTLWRHDPWKWPREGIRWKHYNTIDSTPQVKEINPRNLSGPSFYLAIYWYMPNARHATILRILLCSIHLISIIFLALAATGRLFIRLSDLFFLNIWQCLLSFSLRLLFARLIYSCLLFLHAHSQS